MYIFQMFLDKWIEFNLIKKAKTIFMQLTMDEDLYIKNVLWHKTNGNNEIVSF